MRDEKITAWSSQDTPVGGKVHLPFLDGIRGVSILGVFFFHCLSSAFGFAELPWRGFLRDFDVPLPFLMLLPFTYGWAGVACFFVVSGFCIHLSGVTGDASASWSVFALRRFLRLYPPYFVAVCFFFIVSVVVGTTQLHRISSFVQLGAHLSMLHNFDQRTLFGINPSFWSVAVEVQLYLLYPLVWYLSRRLGWQLTLVFVGLPEGLIALASSVSLNMLGAALPCFVVNSPFAFWFSWTLGAYLCDCWRSGCRCWLSGVRADVMFFVALMLPMTKITSPFAFVAFAVLTAVVIERLLYRRWSGCGFFLPGRVWQGFSVLGAASYSFYLFHQPPLGYFGRMLEGYCSVFFETSMMRFWGSVMLFPLLLVVSVFSYRRLEQPFARFGKSVGSRMRS